MRLSGRDHLILTLVVIFVVAPVAALVIACVFLFTRVRL
jgi:multisubunit Na+/H+ antiporter MnhG subunit